MFWKFISVTLLVILLLHGSALGAEKYQIDPAHAFVNFSISHFVTGKARGSFKDVSGTILFDEKDVTKSSVEVVIKTASINTNHDGRDKHLRSADFFDVGKYPEMTFKSKRIEKSCSGFLAVSDMILRGVTKEVAMPFTFTSPFKDPLAAGEKRMLVEASLKIDRRDFGLVWNRVMEGGGLFIGNEVEIAINVEAFLPKTKTGN
ncbi:MAG: YceI family protein [Acidobacteriota bacterium]|nr:YceI family protein [Acidobacteriota bacterium]